MVFLNKPVETSKISKGNGRDGDLPKCIKQAAVTSMTGIHLPVAHAPRHLQTPNSLQQEHLAITPSPAPITDKHTIGEQCGSGQRDRSRDVVKGFWVKFSCKELK